MNFLWKENESTISKHCLPFQDEHLCKIRDHFDMPLLCFYEEIRVLGPNFEIQARDSRPMRREEPPSHGSPN